MQDSNSGQPSSSNTSMDDETPPRGRAEELIKQGNNSKLHSLLYNDPHFNTSTEQGSHDLLQLFRVAHCLYLASLNRYEDARMRLSAIAPNEVPHIPAPTPDNSLLDDVNCLKNRHASQAQTIDQLTQDPHERGAIETLRKTVKAMLEYVQQMECRADGSNDVRYVIVRTVVRSNKLEEGAREVENMVRIVAQGEGGQDGAAQS